MCFATMALVAGVAGSAVSAAGTLYAGEAAQNAANYRAKVAQNNAIIAEQNATYTEESGRVKAANESLKGAAIGARIKTAQAASGIDVNTGSAVDVQASQRENSKLDTETTMSNSELQAYGYRTQATNFTAQSGLETMEGESAKTGSEFAAAGTLLGGASSTGYKWSSLGNTSGV